MERQTLVTDRETNDSSKNDMAAEISTYTQIDELIGNPYCFESDHVALKGNLDYQRLLRSIVMLEAQRAKGLADLEALHEAQKKASEDPEGFVSKLWKGENDLNISEPQNIVEIPEVSWERYTNSVDFSSFGVHRQSSRLKKNGSESTEDENLQRLKANLVGGPDNCDSVEGFVRGRYRNDKKSATFNQLWTCEEQKRLEDLLQKFPPEEVEARRWRKIADALGNRTPQQVASRVQKYFEKLEKARLPIPGRVPNRIGRYRVTKFKRGHRQTRWSSFRESTFLHSFKPPAAIKDDGDNSYMLDNLSMYLSEEHDSIPSTSTHNTQQEDDIPEEIKQSSRYSHLLHLRALRQESLKIAEPSVIVHREYRCDRCGCDPIVGPRWHCVDCPTSMTVDFCEKCADSHGSLETASHNTSHRVRPVKRTWKKQTQDRDYMTFHNKTNEQLYYLDPNFMPAV